MTGLVEQGRERRVSVVGPVSSALKWSSGFPAVSGFIRVIWKRRSSSAPSVSPSSHVYRSTYITCHVCGPDRSGMLWFCSSLIRLTEDVKQYMDVNGIIIKVHLLCPFRLFSSLRGHF